jgi:hypothetical protein
MLGPIDYIVVGFNGNNFDGSIISELAKATDSGAIRVVDLVFIIKDIDGNFAIAELSDQHEELKEVVNTVGFDDNLPLLTESDLEKISESMDNDTSAGVLVIEHLWAKGLKTALINAGGVLLDEGRIHPDNVVAAVEEIEQIAN